MKTINVYVGYMIVEDDGNVFTEPSRLSSDGICQRLVAPSEFPRANGRVDVRASSVPPVG
jgi:hypothetical protein